MSESPKEAQTLSSYFSGKHKPGHQAFHYSKINESAHRFLAYRDVPSLIQKYLSAEKHNRLALDYGTGAGYSAKFLQDIGFTVVGADVSKEMLLQAQSRYPEIEFLMVENGKIPKEPSTFELVFSSFVLFEMGSKDEIVEYLLEAKRVLKKEGIVVAVTGSENLHSPSRQWLSFHTDFPQNKNLFSGKPVKLLLRELNIEFHDYFWHENDYKVLFDRVGLETKAIHYPLGFKTEPYSWKDEIDYAPFVIFVAQNK
jgi:ubiquinone/menaquinone biosynthesis C-methylase UbiE